MVLSSANKVVLIDTVVVEFIHDNVDTIMAILFTLRL